MSTSNVRKESHLFCLFSALFSKKWSDIIDNNQCGHRVLLTCFKQSNLVHKLGKYSGGSKVIDTRMDKASLELQAIDLMAFKLKLVLCLPKPCKRSVYFQCFGAEKIKDKNVNSLHLITNLQDSLQLQIFPRIQNALSPSPGP